MVLSSIPYIQINVNELKLRLHPKSRAQVINRFDSPYRRLYLSVIGLFVNEMKRLRKIKSIPPQEHLRKRKLAEVFHG